MAAVTTREGPVVIAGGSGFLGRSLARTLRAEGRDVCVLGRAASPATPLPQGVQWYQWDARTVGDWARRLDGASALVNFVGRSVDCRKTPENVQVILQSRSDSCRVLGEALRTVAAPPPVWVQSATAHIIGDPSPADMVCDDATPPGPQEELAPRVGVAWERAFDEALLPDQRGVVLRISFVLGRGGGALAQLHTLTRWGLGGTVGNGNQWISWIHEADLDRIICNAMDDPAYSGAYMATAPGPVTNREFMRMMRRVHRRPWSPPAPALAVRFAARFLLRTDPELALKGRRCVPTRLLREHGFHFEHEELETALRDLCAAPQAATR